MKYINLSFFILITTLLSIKSLAFDVTTFIALSKQKTLFDNAEIIANNIANAETPGFKESKLVERLYSVEFPNVKSNQYANDISSVINMESGGLIQTRNSLDLAIAGEGFFIVQTTNGERYTRAGNFTISNSGNLVTMDGYNVLGAQKNEIAIPANANEIMFKENGDIVVNGAITGRLGIGSFANYYMLEQEGKSLFKHKNNIASDIAEPTKFKVLQGFLEASNVNKIRQLTTLIEVQRDTGYISNLLNTYDDMSRNVISKLGRN